MSRTPAKIVGALTAAFVVTACVANNASLLIIGLLSPPLSTGSSAGCVYTANLTGPFMSNGTMDLAFEEEYTPTLLLGNQLVPEGNPSQVRIETNAITIQGAIVRVTDSSGGTLDNYTVPGVAFIEPSSGGTPGLATFSTTLISPAAADAARQSIGSSTNFATKRLIANVKVFGITTGGTHIESGEVGIPVNACNGCLVIFPAGSDDPAQATQPNCLASTSGGGATIVSPCVLGQDQPVDCRLCQGNVACDPALR